MNLSRKEREPVDAHNKYINKDWSFFFYQDLTNREFPVDMASASVGLLNKRTSTNTLDRLRESLLLLEPHRLCARYLRDPNPHKTTLSVRMYVS